MIQFENVTKEYSNGHLALDDVSFSLAKGEMAFLLGHSGAGKTTVLRLITLLERASKGSITLAEQQLNRLKKRNLPFLRREIGFIFQDHRLLQNRTVQDNVSLPLLICGMQKDIAQKRVRAALSKVGLEGLENRKPDTLSVGEQQRVGIARAVVNRPSILLADEPTGNLDTGLSTEIFDIFKDFNSVGVTVLVASHDVAQVERSGKRVIELAQGQIFDDGL